MSVESRDQRLLVWRMGTLVLCVFVLAMQLAQVLWCLSPETVRLLDIADTMVCSVFLVDFAIQFGRSTNRWKYLMTWGWLDLLSSIPSMPLLRWGRGARILRILRVLRTARVAKHMTAFLAENRARNTFVAVTLGSFIAMVCGALAVMNMESGADTNISTAGDALWWAFATITTVGAAEIVTRSLLAGDQLRQFS